MQFDEFGHMQIPMKSSHRHNQGNKNIYHLQKFPLVPLLCYCDRKSEHGIYPLHKILSV